MATITRIPLEQSPLVFWAPNTRAITAIELHQHDSFVTIAPVGVRNITINGGFRICREDMRKLCEQFLELDSKSQEA